MKTVMEQECRPIAGFIPEPHQFIQVRKWNSCEELIVSPQTTPDNSHPTRIQTSQRIHLALEELQCFEVIKEQFLAWGITFVNAIALQPSNPAFGIQPNQTVLMGAPRSGWLEVHFQYPVRKVEAIVTSSRRTTLSAYDDKGQEVQQAEMVKALDRRSLPMVLPSDQLCVQGPNIHKVTFYTFDSQLILDQFKVEF
ncbi:MAG: hypothetical protein AAFO04_07125 [Cyanobacteria bacterium J06592_8]